MQPPEHVQLVRPHVPGLIRGARTQANLQRAGHALGDGVLHLEDVRELFVELAGPQLPAVGGPQQSRRCTDTVVGDLHRAVHDGFYCELPARFQRILIDSGDSGASC